MTETTEIVTVDAENLDEHGFFCYKSKPKTEGYQRKRAWLLERFKEGLQIKLLYEGKRSIAFIEYIPAEYAWRPVLANGYLFIHCIWVVGKGKGKGYGSRLLAACEDEARARGLNGVAMTASSRVWMAGADLLLKNGYQVADQFAPFSLLAKSFNNTEPPRFPTNWEERARRYPQGLTVLYTDQCPYIPDATSIVHEAGAEQAIPVQTILLKSADEVQTLSPSPYGVFNMVYNGKLFSYHYLLKKDFPELLRKAVS